jgi:small-conductance mechanosensitive channel
VGDRITASGVLDSETLLVQRVDLLSSTFLRPTARLITVPNFLLYTMSIENLKRSPQAVLRLVLTVPATASAMQLEGLRRRVNGYLERRPGAWKPGCTIRALALRDQALDLTLWASSRFRYQELPRLMKAQTELWLHLLAAAREEGLAYRAADTTVRLEGWPGGTLPPIVSGGDRATGEAPATI